MQIQLIAIAKKNYNASVTVVKCYHIVTGQPLPGELTISQLLLLLQDRGLPCGSGLLELNKSVTSKNKSSGRQDKKLKTLDGKLGCFSDKPVKPLKIIRISMIRQFRFIYTKPKILLQH